MNMEMAKKVGFIALVTLGTMYAVNKIGALDPVRKAVGQ